MKDVFELYNLALTHLPHASMHTLFYMIFILYEMLTVL